MTNPSRSTPFPYGPSGARPSMHHDNGADPAGGRPQPAVEVAAYPDYASAQRAVDYLSDNRFPVDRVKIVGSGVRLVEQVHGRLTVGRAALAGAGTGAWFGLLIGILLGAFAVGAWWRVLVFAILAGLVWGAAFGALAHSATRGRRDFSSTPTLQADTYSVMVDADAAGEARDLLSRMPTAPGA